MKVSKFCFILLPIYTHLQEFATAAILILLLIGSNSNAGEIVTWTDEYGNLNITNQSPPEGVMVQNVIQYKEKTDEEIREYKRLQEKKRQDRLKQAKIQEAQKAKKEAGKAKKEAEEAEARAEEATRNANEYINKYSSRKKKKRKAYRSRARKLVEEAEKAKALAIQAVNKANQAEKDAKEVAKIVQEFDSQNPQALQSDLQEPKGLNQTVHE